MPVLLTVRFADRPTTTFLLEDDSEHLIGRDPEASVVLDDDRVSRHHARLRPGGEAWTVEDLESKNGTALDGRRIDSAPLPERAWLSLGGVPIEARQLSAEQAREQAERRRRRLTASQQIQRRISSDQGLDQLLDNLLTSAIEVARADRGFVLLRDGADGFTVVTRRGLTAEALSDEEFRGSIGAVQRTLETSEPTVANDLSMHPVLGRRASIARKGIQSLICLPLSVHERLLGALYLDLEANPDPTAPSTSFDDLDLEILEALAGHAALALSVARLDRELQSIAGSVGTGSGALATAADSSLNWGPIAARLQSGG